jgi:hypothetical protein
LNDIGFIMAFDPAELKRNIREIIIQIDEIMK